MHVTSLTTRVLTFGGTEVAIEYTDGRSAEIVDFLFERIPRVAGNGATQARFRLVEDRANGVFTLTQHHETCCIDRSAGAIASWLLHATFRQLALAAAPTRGLLLHAAAVERQGRGLLLPGSSGSGKSTLTALLAIRGFDYLTDELVHVPLESTDVEGFTAPLKIKMAGLEAMKGQDPLITGGRASMAGVHDLLVQPGDGRLTAAASLSLIVFPHYQRHGRFHLKALSPAETALRLMAGVLNAERLPDHGFREVARLAGLAAGYVMRYASLAQVESHLELLRHITAASGSSRARRREFKALRASSVAPD